MAHLSELEKRVSELDATSARESNGVRTEEEALALKAQYLGKKGRVAELMRLLAEAAPEQRRELGKVINTLKETLEDRFEKKLGQLAAEAQNEALEKSAVDITRPARERWSGTLHPLTQTMQRIIEVFSSLGFSIADGPEVEHDFYNFEALNFPKNHPARDMQDTFFLAPDVVLRTHTSPVQIRQLLKTAPPVRIICPGKVYRCDADLTHSPMFHQVEGLWVDEKVSMADLKGVLRAFAERLFGTQTKVRLRPSYFPFVEPGAEVDVTCLLCGGKGCRVCKGTGFLEILGAGMVHPNVLTSVGLDPEVMRGFAFGMGVERIAILLHGIDDIRVFFENDLRFLRQFP